MLTRAPMLRLCKILKFSDFLFSKPVLSRFLSTSEVLRMELKEVVKRLEQFAPTSLAGSWDNVGLLLEPMQKKPVSRLLLTNDLTEPVLEEALKLEVDMIISYHPPLFKPMKRLTAENWKERIVIQCLENKIAVYSPHTAWDAVQGGINEWLLLPFGPGKSCPCESQVDPSTSSFSIQIPNSQTLICEKRELEHEFLKIREDVRSQVQITKHEPHPRPGVGPGRVSHLESSLRLDEAISKIKEHLKLTHVRLALANNHTLSSQVSRVGVCAGSGASVLGGVRADLILTGEMSHHEVLDFVHRGVSVILTDHSNTERGFLTHIRPRLSSLFEDNIQILISTIDRDPLEVV
ncbi:NIF3-like protein 1 [Eurytemora carolleeae]|uniref:NIF3-like protein 1 n=1 Tax=Eurytemora carolleeae TaxID=1294199 RepID=UPI000C76B6A7|nr:NIF3-like protein 1 [Eurytemora carolleeae]|eukprot:XP_023339560.1 NIF3-like protein 1 [Eurytemora affinis]